MGLLSTTARFQLLDTGFWLTTFEKNNVYDNFAKVLKTSTEKQTIKEGGNIGDAAFLTNLLTPENLKDITEKNLSNALTFLNGKSEELIVYIPVSKIPKDLLPKTIKPISEQMTAEELLKEFNIMGVKSAQIKNLSSIGSWTTYFWLTNFGLIVLVIFLLIRLVNNGSRFVAPGLVFILSGILTLAVVLFGFVVRGSMLTDWVKSSEPSQIILATFAPYIFWGVLRVWLFAGIGLLASGVLLLFLKKR